MATKKNSTTKASALRIRLTETQLKKLSTQKRPERLADGSVVWMDNPTLEPYQFLLDVAEAMAGFGVYVGARGASYRVRRKHEGKFYKLVVAPVADVTLTQAIEKSRQLWAALMETGKHPTQAKKAQAEDLATSEITVGQCLERYLSHLRTRSNRAKPATLLSVESACERLKRPEVDLYDAPVRTLTRERLVEGWRRLRTSAMERSSRLPTAIKAQLKASSTPWTDLEDSTLEAMGIRGREAVKVRAAGLAAAEHTFADASRGVQLVLTQEAREAKRDNRAPLLHGNPFDEVKDQYRSINQLRTYYRTAEVRNPLNDDTLRNVLKAIVARRSEQGALNRTAADYLLLTLLWGARREESARLKWYDLCSPDERQREAVSWVWLTDDEEAVHPTTKKKGSQVFFHDTKNGDVRLLPITYFAKRILRQRLDERRGLEGALPALVARAEKAYKTLQTDSRDARKWGAQAIKLETERARLERLCWVFPARSLKARNGYYSSSKSILSNIRVDAGLVDLNKEVDQGLTPHDLRRTLGRYAGKMLAGPIVSQLLHHRVNDGSAASDVYYTEQEWNHLKDCLAQVEERMIATSPRVWNYLKGSDRPFLDEVNDPPIQIFKAKKTVLLSDLNAECDD
ncbi:site-specific integrase [Frateuria aurantia]